MSWNVTTNNHRRPVVDGWELTPAERDEFDYIDWAAVEAGSDSASFVRYRGQLIDLGDMPGAEGEIAAMGWHGFASDSFFSGIAVRYPDESDWETVVVATLYAE